MRSRDNADGEVETGIFPAPPPPKKNRSIFAHSLPLPTCWFKADNAESSSPELRRQHIDFVLDEVSETSFTPVVIMVEHQCLTSCTSPPYVSRQPSWKLLRDANVCEH